MFKNNTYRWIDKEGFSLDFKDSSIRFNFEENSLFMAKKNISLQVRELDEVLTDYMDSVRVFRWTAEEEKELFSLILETREVFNKHKNNEFFDEYALIYNEYSKKWFIRKDSKQKFEEEAFNTPEEAICRAGF